MNVQNPSTSQKNREELQEWFKNSEYTDIKFWIPPNVVASPDECVAEIVEALTKFDTEKKNQELKTDGDDLKY